MSPTSNSISTVDVARLIETDLQAHVEDDIKVNAVRDGKLVEVSWNDLTEDERRAAYVATFHPCCWEEAEL
ncbi:MAG TPA: hypothetical protein VEL31_06880 [Ktedonobacteraceae bacterium]|nr:hypothetical protein [Ktedonobacteraceae bacterium]